MEYKNLTVREIADNKVTFIASTATIDRYGDVINQDGWDLSAYSRNPVVLYNHNANSLPIGKGTVYLKDGQLMIDVNFDQNDPDAQKIESKVKGGYISAVSVGFQPLEAKSRADLPKDHYAYGTRGQFFNKQELLEVSVVTIPANNMATLSKNMETRIGLKNIIRSMIVEEIKHILSVEELDNGDYVVTFAGKHEDMPAEETPVEPPPAEEPPADQQESIDENKNFLSDILSNLKQYTK